MQDVKGSVLLDKQCTLKDGVPEKLSLSWSSKKDSARMFCLCTKDRVFELRAASETQAAAWKTYLQEVRMSAVLVLQWLILVPSPVAISTCCRPAQVISGEVPDIPEELHHEPSISRSQTLGLSKLGAEIVKLQKRSSQGDLELGSHKVLCNDT